MPFTAQGSRLCVGLDPSAAVLASWGLPDTANGLDAFCNICTGALAQTPGPVKIQAAFFERFGASGAAHMWELARNLKAQGCDIILDAKRSDIGSTAAAYADAYLQDSAPTDALTVVPWFGIEALAPFFSRAAETGRLVFVVVRASNPESTPLQTARSAPGGPTLAETLCDAIARHNKRSGHKTAGAVIGATQATEFAPLAARLGGALILAPGIGAQGASLASLHRAAGPHYPRTIPAASRSLLQAGPDPAALADAIACARAEDKSLRL